MPDYYAVYNDEALRHHGVKGMRWGIRKERKRNPDYSSKQRIRDRKLYGRGAERRINKRMNNGESVQSARHNEVVKKNRKRKAKNVVAVVGSAAVATGGAIAVHSVLKKHGVNPIAANSITKSAVAIGKSLIDAMFR